MRALQVEAFGDPQALFVQDIAPRAPGRGEVQVRIAGVGVGFFDGLLINGSAKVVALFAGVMRLVQTGHLYWYALVMILGVIGLMTWQLWPHLSGLLGKSF